MTRQRDLAHRSRQAASRNGWRPTSVCPDAVKFDADGLHRVHPGGQRSGAAHRSAQRRADACWLSSTRDWTTCTFVGDRLFVSNFTGEITEILAGGDTRTVLPGGLNWPLDLAVGDDGRLYVADGTYFYAVAPDGSLQTVGHAVLAGLSRLPARAGARRRRRVRGDHLRRPGRPVPTGGERNRLSGRPTSTSSTASPIGPGDGDRVRRTRHRPSACSAVGQRRDAGVRTAAIRSASRSTPTAQSLVAESGAGRVVAADRRPAPRPWSTDCSARRASSCATASSTSSTPAPRRSSRST